MKQRRRCAQLLAALSAVTVVACGDAAPECVESVRGETMLEPEWTYVPGGEFRVGTDRHPVFESPSIEVQLANGFWIQTSEVTWFEFGRVLERFREEFPDRRQSPNAVEKQIDLSVYGWMPSQHDVFAPLYYAYARSLLEGLEPCYDLDACEILTSGASNSELDRLQAMCARWLLSTSEPYCEGYRLPTLAEWERAAGAGTCSDSSCIERTEWSLESSGGGPRDFGARTVGGRCANDRGVYDILSNAREWTSELFQFGAGFESYPGGPDPAFARAELTFDNSALPFGGEPRCEGVDDACGSVVLLKGADGRASRSEIGHWNVAYSFGNDPAGFRLVRGGSVSSDGP